MVLAMLHMTPLSPMTLLLLLTMDTEARGLQPPHRTGEACVAAAVAAHFQLDHQPLPSLALLVAQSPGLLLDLPLPLDQIPTILIAGIQRDGSWPEELPGEQGRDAELLLVALHEAPLLDAVLGRLQAQLGSLAPRLFVLLRLEGEQQAREHVVLALQLAHKYNIQDSAVATISATQHAPVQLFGWTNSLQQGSSHPRLITSCPRQSSLREAASLLADLPRPPPRVSPRPARQLEEQGLRAVGWCAGEQPTPALQHLDGVEIRLVRTVLAAMGLEAHFYLPPGGLEWGSVFPNGSGTGLMGELAKGRADIAVGGIIPLTERALRFDMSRSYAVSRLTWAVPKPRPKPSWMSLVAPFSLYTWLVLALVFVMTVLGGLLIARHHVISGGAFLFPWGTMLGMSAARLPERAWLRLCLTAWLSACLVLSAAYQGALFSELASPRPLQAPDSLAELVDAGLPLGGHPGFRSLLTGCDPRVSAAAHKAYFPILQNITTMLDEVASGQRDVALIFGSAILHWYNARNRASGNTVHVASETLSSFPISSYLQPNSPLQPRYDTLVQALVEGGFTTKWQADLSPSQSGGLEQPAGPHALGLRHLGASFLCLGLGLTLATATFLLELIVGGLCARGGARTTPVS